MTDKITIFGYGSLMNLDFLCKTVPNVTDITPVILQNHIRIFETASTTRFDKDNTPAAVLNITEHNEAKINGVCFHVEQDYFDELLEREKAYELREVVVETCDTGEKMKAFVFVDKMKQKQNFLFDEETQIDYLNICLEGARQFGEEFYRMFLESTHINNKKLIEINEIKHLL